MGIASHGMACCSGHIPLAPVRPRGGTFGSVSRHGRFGHSSEIRLQWKLDRIVGLADVGGLGPWTALPTDRHRFGLVRKYLRFGHG